MRFSALQLRKSPPKLCQLFDSLVRPGLEWGSEVWAPALLNCERGWAEGDRVPLFFLRGILAVRGGTPSLTVLAELGQYPLLWQYPHGKAGYTFLAAFRTPGGLKAGQRSVLGE